MNKLLEHPNWTSVGILVIIVAIAGTYGFLTYTQRPEMESFNVDPDYAFDFNFDRATKVTKLPGKLEEISGLCTWKNENEVLAVQDEDGEVFVVNVQSGKITERVKFGKDRDYEGIARVGDTIYVLEADGDMHRFTYREGEDKFDAEKMETPFSYRNDTEGIVYDPLTNVLLIAPKEQELNPSEADQNRRGIYAYDLATGSMAQQPAYYIDEAEIGQAIYNKTSRYVIKPSGLAVDPITNDIYVLSSVGNILVVIDRDSELKHIELLEKGTFRQPEGIAFNERGDLYISSEGRGGDGVIAILAREKRTQTTGTDE